MDKFNTYTSLKSVAQLYYGTDDYGAQEYSCQDGESECIVSVGAPNTGFMGMSQSMTIGLGIGAVLIIAAVIGTIVVLTSRSRRRNKEQG